MNSAISFQVWYFFRIFIVFYILWLPGMFLVVIGASKEDYGNLICIGYLFCSIQPIISTCMAMSKSYVRKDTKDLITLSYITTERLVESTMMKEEELLVLLLR
jgi:hypothetical protein